MQFIAHIVIFILHAVALTKPGVDLALEENLLLLNYKTRGGGRPSALAANHLKQSADAVLLAHKRGDGRNTFTCNKKVTVDDVYGHGSEVSPPVLAVMGDLPYEGASTDIPTRALQFLINR